MAELLEEAMTRTANRSSTPALNASCKQIQKGQGLARPLAHCAVDFKTDGLKVERQGRERDFLHEKVL